jgi:hypothetical protein
VPELLNVNVPPPVLMRSPAKLAIPVPVRERTALAPLLLTFPENAKVPILAVIVAAFVSDTWENVIVPAFVDF